MNNSRLISVCIPAFEMNGMGPVFLRESLDILCVQSFRDFDVVISDESKDDSIKKVCDDYTTKLDIKYHKNPEGLRQFAQNTNFAIKKATGKLVKILLLDDFPYGKDALKNIADNFDLENDHWLVTACEHSTDGKTFFKPFYPRFHKKIHYGRNTISSPSVLTIKNKDPLLFDVGLKWYVDCEYYKRCYDKFGLPKIVNKISVVNRLTPHQTTHIISQNLKDTEFLDVLKRYYSPLHAQLLLRTKKITRHIHNIVMFIKKQICS